MPAPLTIGPGREKTVFHTVQYGDYGALYPHADAWTAPTWHSLMRSEPPGLASICSSTDSATPINRTRQRGRVAGGSRPTKEAARGRRLAVAPRKAVLDSPFEQTLSDYSARGIEQMSILMMNDAGLPLGGAGFDQRKPEQLLDALTRITQHSNVSGVSRLELVVQLVGLQERGAEAAKTPRKKRPTSRPRSWRGNGFVGPGTGSCLRLPTRLRRRCSSYCSTSAQGTRPRPCDGCGQSVPQCRLVSARSA